MSEPFIAEIRIFAGNFAPRGWAFCNGQLLPIAQNTALFSLIGVTYGGDGRTTTALPNLEGRAPMHAGRGPGLTARRLGERGGSEAVVLSETQLAAHSHALQGEEEDASQTDPNNRAYAKADDDLYNDTGTVVAMSAQTTQNTGGGQPHNNMQPFLTINFIIALVGIYPSRG
ncbi:MAG: phage tail protein [Chloroflexi bacterium]|nr:phage tail protein [Chloroflexota bacterium]